MIWIEQCWKRSWRSICHSWSALGIGWLECSFTNLSLMFMEAEKCTFSPHIFQVVEHLRRICSAHTAQVFAELRRVLWGDSSFQPLGPFTMPHEVRGRHTRICYCAGRDSQCCFSVISAGWQKDRVVLSVSDDDLGYPPLLKRHEGSLSSQTILVAVVVRVTCWVNCTVMSKALYRQVSECLLLKTHVIGMVPWPLHLSMSSFPFWIIQRVNMARDCHHTQC